MKADFADLVGVPYANRDCYAVVRDALRRLGIELPMDAAMCLSECMTDPIAIDVPMGEVCRLGDVLWIRNADRTHHVGMALDAFTFLHATRGGHSRIDRIDRWRRARLVWRVMRPKELV